MIPKIIHQTGPTDKSRWHPLWYKCQQSWLDHFKDFEYKFWNDEDMYFFVKQNYLKYYQMFIEFHHHIMRVNFFRFCLLHYYGGIYADLDIFCYENFYKDLNNNFFLNQNSTEEFGNSIFKVENSLIISNLNKKKYFEEVMDVCLLRHQQKNLDIEFVSGSIPLSDVLNHNFSNFSFLPDWKFNNLTGAYFKGIKTKHIRTSSWCTKFSKKIIVVNGLIINEPLTNQLTNFFHQKKWKYYFLDWEKFNFYFDYSCNNFLTPCNKQKIVNSVYNTKSQIFKFLYGNNLNLYYD